MTFSPAVRSAIQPRSIYADVLGHELHATVWGEDDAPPVLMWHGLARTGRDFDVIAAALCHRYRVICPDQIGRGLSQWSQTADSDYCLDHYVAVAEALMDSLGLDTVLWVGTSMGGATGMRAAATRLRGRITRLVVNDIGPTLPEPALNRIRSYVGTPPAYATMAEFERMIRFIYAPFGTHTDAQWRHLAETSVRRLPDGRVTSHYDPKIVRQFEVHTEDYEQWPVYDALALPVLLLRGATSDLLLADVAQDMTRRGPKARLVEIAGCGHAPGLNTPEQIALVSEFLTATA